MPTADLLFDWNHDRNRDRESGEHGAVGAVAIDTCVDTRDTVERFVRYCLARASAAGRRAVTLVHKANAVPNTGRRWQGVFRAGLAGACCWRTSVSPARPRRCASA
jgi:isocitrate/isopropylmalate dehydrogenase